jgi:hypothetical protein
MLLCKNFGGVPPLAIRQCDDTRREGVRSDRKTGTKRNPGFPVFLLPRSRLRPRGQGSLRQNPAARQHVRQLLTMPIAWKGTSVQYTGLHRDHPSNATSASTTTSTPTFPFSGECTPSGSARPRTWAMRRTTSSPSNSVPHPSERLAVSGGLELRAVHSQERGHLDSWPQSPRGATFGLRVDEQLTRDPGTDDSKGRRAARRVVKSIATSVRSVS